MERNKGDAKLMDPWQTLKVANKQLKTLNQADRRFVGSRAHQLRKSTVSEGGENYGIIYVDSCNPIPENIPLLVEDVCNNLRAVLDHISWKVWLKEEPNSSKPLYSPICDTAILFEIEASEHIGGLPQNQQAIFEAVQPYNRENNYLSILRELNNADNND